MPETSISVSESNAPAKELGFSVKQGVNWSNYLAYRPIYPASFFERVYGYHAQKPGASWSIAHDIGAGCGVVASTLATRFSSVIVSDPNDGYVTLARKLLVGEASLPESKFEFLQEPAEKSSVQSGTVDLATACECIPWAVPDVAIREFCRELKPGGTLLITYYTRPKITASELAEKAWEAVWAVHSEKAQGELFDKAFVIVNTALENLEFPEEEWDTVKRVYINAQGSVDAFRMNNLKGESKVKEGEEKIWVEDDEDWCDMHGFEWFKAYLATWVPFIPEAEMQEVWDELEISLEGKQVKTRTPVVMVFATKKA
ncbi:S-adenosyl-L-methionine-dependent methyltransferase [Hypoxylon crocopeplum]|nr:S-adenosyl-L-methionine-dependent methyltransferase [Hypoxylon crocopeplum]